MKSGAMLLMTLLVLLSELCLYCAGFAINSSGSGIYGDPAPGRSPGPPTLSNTAEELGVPVQTAETPGNECILGQVVNVATGDEAALNITVTHTLFKSDMLIPAIKYQVIISRTTLGPPIDFLVSSTMNEMPWGQFSNFQEYSCGSHIFRSQLIDSQISLNWTFEGNNEILKTNITFRLHFAVHDDPTVYEVLYGVPASLECQLYLTSGEGIFSHKELPRLQDCRVWFPAHAEGHGLVIELTRLNVPCTRGYVHFSGLNTTTKQHYRSHKQAHLCGKLEEIPEADRHIYFPSSHTQPLLHAHGDPVFAIAYRLVDYCYNVTFIGRNGSFELKPTGELQCSFKIYLPYGNRVALKLQIGDASSKDSPETSSGFQEYKNGKIQCEGLLTQLHDGESLWSHCTKPGDAQRRIEVVSRENKVLLKVSVRNTRESALGLKMWYRAEPIEEIVGVCGFGWASLRSFCVTAVEEARLPWAQAEIECARRGGHLASIRGKDDQRLLDKLLNNSPGYRDHNAYWIGASDKTHEGDFKWTDGLSFSYTNWFPGWPQYQHYNRQPNDDGLSKQDCVEIRRTFTIPTGVSSLADTFMWNDRDCSTPNYFVCERPQNDEPLEEDWPPDCNRSVVLSRQQPRVTVSSPGFPRHYPDNADCDTDIAAPPGYKIVLDFEELVIENEPTCSYDFLEILENTTSLSSSGRNGTSSRRLCGDWSSRLKLLRHVSHGSKLKLRFSSDYSHHFGGFKLRVSMENAMQCSDDRLHMFNNSCYFIGNYPEVTWNTAQQICRGMKATLASILTPEEEMFIKTNIRKTSEYRTSALYWLGARAELGSDFKWVDGQAMIYEGWPPGNRPKELNSGMDPKGPSCLGIQWTPSPTPILPSGLYWKTQKCGMVGGYVCKRRQQLLGSELNFNKTLNSSEGSLSTPNYPGNYYNNLDFSVRIVGPERSRVVIRFEKIDIEYQPECLYDYVELRSVLKNRKQDNGAVKWCGSHDTQMERFDFVSETNEVEVNFHSDYSIAGSGFFLTWKAVDVSACPTQTLTAKEGELSSPNYPHFLLSRLDCTITIQASPGKRIWLEFSNVDLGHSFANTEVINNVEETNAAKIELNLGKRSNIFRPFQTVGLLTEGSFLSEEDRVKLKLITTDDPQGRGFRASYRIITNEAKEEKIVKLNNDTSGTLMHLNYPDSPPTNVDFLQHFVAPVGYIISLELHNVRLSESDCEDGNGVIQVYDHYSDSNGTYWRLCYDESGEAISPETPIHISSFLNTLHLRQRSGSLGIPLNGSLKVQLDSMYKSKLIKYKNNDVESCSPNPCLNEGKCVTKKSRKTCQCIGHFTGLFCSITQCDLEPCIFGTCALTNTSYKCHCKTGYVGPTCEQKRKPCEGNPCESRGTCIEKGDAFLCRCHAWWEGQRCEKRMLHIPYKPLSERMLHEPFWLGLMTVFVVMAVIGLVWCAKRHFPEKIEKLLAEEESRNRGTSHSLRSASVREQLAAASNAAVVNATPSPGGATPAPRSLFGRLGIRKPSILSLTSPHASGYAPATARTFSLDDLLKTAPRRTPSPKKKRNNSTPTKKNVAEKKQILQQLVSPINRQDSRKVSLGELIQMSERKPNETSKENTTQKETKFTEGDPAHAALNDPKLEKKVTFARLLNKVSAEMSSGSDMEMGIMQSNRLGIMFARPSSTPPSPNVDARSPNSTSSNQGSDSFTSSDLAIPCALSSSISDLLISRRHNRLPNGRPKPASADSILAMFRNFSSSSAAVNLPSSLRITPSTTPTASSPQDDIVGDDESSSSSVQTPISFSSGPPESPVLHRGFNQSTIEVPVLDALTAHKSSAASGSNLLHPPTILLEIPSTINKCLSPIREMPTPLPSPMPSPALTPIMRRGTVTSPTTRRSTASSSLEEADISDDRISIEIPNISVSCSDGEDEDIHCTDIAIDPQAEDGLILEEAAAMQHGALFRTKNRPPPLGQISDREQIIPKIGPPPLVIPTLTIQTPSPIHTPKEFNPGSPPPRRHESHFQFPPPKQGRKMFKEFDKPTSLDLPCAPPMITITCNMSEADSDAESISPAMKSTHHHGLTSTGMCYLSPFSMGARGDHNASESNLSSSGYSSMASPGPSRCGSSNPLCPSEMEDQGPPGSGGCHRRLSLTPVLRTIAGNSSGCENIEKADEDQHRGRSDSETLSDDPLVESNDEGIGTDHIDEKIDDGEVKSAKELEIFMTNDIDVKTLLDLPLLPSTTAPRVAKCVSLEDAVERLLIPVSSTSKNSLQLPSIVVQCDSPRCERHLSPMSSRSESPLSDLTTGIGRFSPQFYGKNRDLMPFTDSDGLYDFPSSDKVNVTTTTHKKVGRKREKKTLRSCKTPSPTKHQSLMLHHHLDVPVKDPYKVPPLRKLSPKRRVARSQVVSSSSSSDSINSTREVRISSSSPSPDTIRWSSPVCWLDEKRVKSHEVSAEETGDDFTHVGSTMLSKSLDFTKNCPSKNHKISRLRAISHQIRFLRRLELSLKRKKTVSPSDSMESGDESPRATSPLLQPNKGPKVEIRKSRSIGKLQGGSFTTNNRRGRYKKGELLLSKDETSWQKVVFSGNGHSD